MKVTLYSTGCPKCQVLKAKLDNKNISYDVVSDVSVMTGKGIQTVPVLDVDGQMFGFKEAVQWINER